MVNKFKSWGQVIAAVSSLNNGTSCCNSSDINRNMKVQSRLGMSASNFREMPFDPSLESDDVPEFDPYDSEMENDISADLSEIAKDVIKNKHWSSLTTERFFQSGIYEKYPHEGRIVKALTTLLYQCHTFHEIEVLSKDFVLNLQSARESIYKTGGDTIVKIVPTSRTWSNLITAVTDTKVNPSCELLSFQHLTVNFYLDLYITVIDLRRSNPTAFLFKEGSFDNVKATFRWFIRYSADWYSSYDNNGNFAEHSIYSAHAEYASYYDSRCYKRLYFPAALNNIAFSHFKVELINSCIIESKARGNNALYPNKGLFNVVKPRFMQLMLKLAPEKVQLLYPDSPPVTNKRLLLTTKLYGYYRKLLTSTKHKYLCKVKWWLLSDVFYCEFLRYLLDLNSNVSEFSESSAINILKRIDAKEGMEAATDYLAFLVLQFVFFWALSMEGERIEKSEDSVAK
jgi:hypothetical protein